MIIEKIVIRFNNINNIKLTTWCWIESIMTRYILTIFFIVAKYILTFKFNWNYIYSNPVFEETSQFNTKFISNYRYTQLSK